MKSYNTLRSNFNQYIVDKDLVVDGWIKFMEKSLIIVKNYHFDIKNLLEVFEIENEFELISGIYKQLGNISNMERIEKKYRVKELACLPTGCGNPLFVF